MTGRPIDAFVTAGFRVAVVSEPQPDPAARDLFPGDFPGLSTKPGFLFLVVEVPRSPRVPSQDE
ncbi:hypothetical protein [Streptomyces sp. CRN 30]|uniref:hypothetical protein n=1 Tax=Streptomyces sp. CRN 30 TaxID=3075613 RepID=UPI0039C20760